MNNAARLSARKQWTMNILRHGLGKYKTVNNAKRPVALIDSRAIWSSGQFSWVEQCGWSYCNRLFTEHSRQLDEYIVVHAVLTPVHAACSPDFPRLPRNSILSWFYRQNVLPTSQFWYATRVAKPVFIIQCKKRLVLKEIANDGRYSSSRWIVIKEFPPKWIRLLQEACQMSFWFS